MGLISSLRIKLIPSSISMDKNVSGLSVFLLLRLSKGIDFPKISEIWKELKITKKMGLISASYTWQFLKLGGSGGGIFSWLDMRSIWGSYGFVHIQLSFFRVFYDSYINELCLFARFAMFSRLFHVMGKIWKKCWKSEWMKTTNPGT